MEEGVGWASQELAVGNETRNGNDTERWVMNASEKKFPVFKGIRDAIRNGGKSSPIIYAIDLAISAVAGYVQIIAIAVKVIVEKISYKFTPLAAGVVFLAAVDAQR